MANIYVNLTQAAGGVLTNGYDYGDDANDRAAAASKTTPVATAVRAAAIMLTDDTIIVNDGLYVETGFVNIVKAGITLQAENSGEVTITHATSITRVLHVQFTDFILDGVILDAQDTIQNCITQGTNTGMDLTIRGGTLLNPTNSFILATRLGSLTMNGDWTASANSLSTDGFLLNYSTALGSAGAVSMLDGTITIDDMSVATRYAIELTSSDLSGITCDIHDVNITMGTTTSANEQVGIFVKDMAIINIYNNIITLSDSLVGNGIQVETKTGTVDDATIVNVYNNTTNGVVGASGGRGIHCGSNEDTSPSGVGSLDNVRVFGNTVTGFNHGIFLGWITDARMYSNKVTGTTLGCVAKGTTTCKITGNVVIDNTGSGALLAKGDTDSDFANNLVITNLGVTTTGMIEARISGITNSTGTKWTNNILYNNGGTVTNFVNYIASQTATFVNNDTYSNDAIPANSWVYAGANIADFAAWAAHAQTTGELNVDPEITGLASGDYLARSADLLAGGSNWGEEMYLSEDFNGYPFPAFDISVGAVQGVDIIYNPFACPNL